MGVCSGIGDKGKRRLLLTGPTIQKEMTDYIEKYVRPVRKEKNKEREAKSDEQRKKMVRAAIQNLHFIEIQQLFARTERKKDW